MTASSAMIAKGWSADKGDINRPLRHAKRISQFFVWQPQHFGSEQKLALSSGDVQATLQQLLEVPHRERGCGDDRTRETVKRIDVQRQPR